MAKTKAYSPVVAQHNATVDMCINAFKVWMENKTLGPSDYVQLLKQLKK